MKWKVGGVCGMAMRWLASKLLRQPQRSGVRSTFTPWATGPTMRVISSSSPRNAYPDHAGPHDYTRAGLNTNPAPRSLIPASATIASRARLPCRRPRLRVVPPRRSRAGMPLPPRGWADERRTPTPHNSRQGCHHLKRTQNPKIDRKKSNLRTTGAGYCKSDRTGVDRATLIETKWIEVERDAHTREKRVAATKSTITTASVPGDRNSADTSTGEREALRHRQTASRERTRVW